MPVVLSGVLTFFGGDSLCGDMAEIFSAPQLGEALRRGHAPIGPSPLVFQTGLVWRRRSRTHSILYFAIVVVAGGS